MSDEPPRQDGEPNHKTPVSDRLNWKHTNQPVGQQAPRHTATVTLYERLAKHEQKLTMVLLIGLCAFSWWYLWAGAGTGMSPAAMSEWHLPYTSQSTMHASSALPSSTLTSATLPSMEPMTTNNWGWRYSLIMFFMWWVMMIAMMLPSASPMILLYGRMNRVYYPHHPPSLTVGLFTAGYLVAWGGFSLAAVLLHAVLEKLQIVDQMMMWITEPVLAGSLLLLAGLYQLTPIKNRCLQYCRTPAMFLSQHWQKGLTGAFKIGLHHGGYCLGCCWLLMLLLFVGGAMNLYWILGLALWVAVEKILGPRQVLIWTSSVVLVLAGVNLML